jgi:hypothetical protein
MGITRHTFNLIEKHIKPGIKMLELGDQNIYFGDDYGKYAKPMFQKMGVDHISIDLGTQIGGAVEADLSKPIDRPWENYFDVITNAGTSEHVSSLYECFKSVHKFCKVGGVMIHENPKTGSWPGHGYHYMTEAFYREFSKLMNYELLEAGEHPAMGNIKDGWNIYSVLRKKEDKEFISEKEFNKLDFRKS